MRTGPKVDLALKHAAELIDKLKLRGQVEARRVKLAESEWEAYTRRVIECYALDEAQTAKALSILRACQEQANKRLQRHHSLVKRYQDEVGGKDDESRAERLTQELKDEGEKLQTAIREIFNKQLRPRLAKLPTRAQRRAAEEAGKPGEKAKPADKDETGPAEGTDQP